MGFVYDSRKSFLNKRKHGIDFDEAQALWEDAHLLILPARTEDERRWLAIGGLGGKCWSAVFTVRDTDIRIISVRRARREEVALYESEDL